MEIGIAFDLRPTPGGDEPEDRYDEYDSPGVGRRSNAMPISIR